MPGGWALPSGWVLPGWNARRLVAAGETVTIPRRSSDLDHDRPRPQATRRRRFPAGRTAVSRTAASRATLRRTVPAEVLPLRPGWCGVGEAGRGVEAPDQVEPRGLFLVAAAGYFFAVAIGHDCRAHPCFRACLAGTTPDAACLAGTTPYGACLAGTTPYGACLAGTMPYGTALFARTNSRLPENIAAASLSRVAT